MNVSPAGSNPSVHVPRTGHPTAAAAPKPVQSQAASSVDADGDHDGDTTAGDRLDVRG